MDKKKKYIIYSIILLLVVSLSVGFSAFQKQLLIDDSIFHVRLHEDVRVSDIKVQSSSENVVSNYEDFNVSKLYGSVNFPSANSYILYKLDLSNYGNLKSGLFSITNNESGTSVQLCNSSGGNCTSNFKTSVCNGNNCTLGATKEIYVKVTSSSSGTKMIDIDFDFEPYNTITYTNFREDISSFQDDIMSHDSYQITLSSKPEEVSITGYATYTYNKNTGVLSISDVSSNINIHAKYLINEIAEESYEENNPNNYVSFDNSLYRIITKESVEDGYGNTELRTKIVKHESVGNNIFDENTNVYCNSSLADYLNNTYYEGINSSSKELIDYTTWISKNNEGNTRGTMTPSYNPNKYKATKMAYFFGDSNYCNAIIGLINEDNFSSNSNWLTYDEFTIDNYNTESSGVINTDSKEKSKYNVTLLNTRKVASTATLKAVVSGVLSDSLSDRSLPTHPVTYLKSEVLIVGGTGTSDNPYILGLPSDATQSNPTIITGINQYVTGSNMDLVTVTNKVGTVYYSIDDELNINNYTEGSTSIPKEKNTGKYWISYYIPAGNGYKAKKGTVVSQINPYKYYISYEKGSHVNEIYLESDSCTTTESNITCDVTLPNIVPEEYYDSVGWSTTNGDTTGLLPGTNYTLSSENNNVVLYANTVIQKNYQNTNNNRYYATLKDALDDVSSGQTIKVLNSIRELKEITLSESKTNVMIDLNGKTISLYSATITNNGTLDIYNSSTTEGIIQQTGNDHDLIINNGTLSINKTASTNKTRLKFTADFGGQTLVLNNENKTFNIYTNAILQGYSSSETCVRNYGTTNMYDGTLKGLGLFSNLSSGTFNMFGGTINDIYSNAINNYGTVNISGGTINSSGTGINNFDGGNITINGNVHITTSTNPASSNYRNGIINSGQLNISSGTIEGYYTIKNTSTGDVEITGTAQIISSSYGIINDGTLKVTGGNISGVNRGIQNKNNLTISGSNTVISSTSSSGIAIDNNNGTATMSNGTINSNYTGISNSYKYLTITGGTINGDVVGIINKISGSITIEGGVVNSSGTAISSDSGLVTIGINDSTISTSSPLIQTTGTNDKYGLYIRNSTTYFYDGIIKSSSGLDHSILGNSINVPENYEIRKDLDNGIESAYLKKMPFLMAGTSAAEDANFLRTNIAKKDIETITFTNSISGHTANGTDCFDVSLNEDGTVLAWVTDTDSNGKHEVTIGADNKIYASTGEYLFGYLTNLTSINDLQYLDTSKVTLMNSMFHNCSSLTNLNLSGFNTSNVTIMSAMFYGCSSLTSLDLSNFNTSNVKIMSGLFYG